MRIWNFPDVPVSKQLFHVPGQAMEAGFTSGGVRMLSPTPGGRAVLEMQLSMQVNEWEAPVASWLMSKGNGEVFRVKLAKTPQLLTTRSIRVGSFDAYPRDEKKWQATEQSNAMQTVFTQPALEGNQTVQVNMADIGPLLQLGHVIGHDDYTYLVDDISYDADLVATLTVKPPLRKNIAVNDKCLFEPVFLGTISNINDIRATYDSENVGHIQSGKIIFAEAIV